MTETSFNHEPHVSRLAPSPTGALHLGNLRTFLVNHLMARQRGWRMLMRIEDIDGPRVKAGASEALLEEMSWLGLRWQGEPLVQSQRLAEYMPALRSLIADDHAYPCICSRRDIEQAASAPQQGDDLLVYPGTCARRFSSGDDALAATGAGAGGDASGQAPAWRLRVPQEPIEVDDGLLGQRRFCLTQTCGDFVIYRNNGLPAYQLAVVVDDAASGVNAIVRGDDLLESAARQIHLRRLLGLSPEPRYWHLPLVVGADGRRLAKRHGDTRLAYYRHKGCTAERVLGLLGYWCGIFERRREADMSELEARFDVDCLPREAVVFTAEDDAFLTER